MKLKQNLIIALLATSLLVSSTSYASDSKAEIKKVDENALINMAEKVDENTIITENLKSKSDTTTSNQTNNKIEDKSSSTEKAREKIDQENLEKLEKIDDKIKGTKNKGEIKEENKVNDENKSSLEKKESVNKEEKIIDSKKENPNEEKTNEKSKTEEVKFEPMDRLEEINKQEAKTNNQIIYIEDDNVENKTLEKLTSKETLTTDFNDKGGNLRLNLANTRADSLQKGKNGSRFILSPQTIILIIAILAAIFSAISIAIKGAKAKYKK